MKKFPAWIPAVLALVVPAAFAPPAFARIEELSLKEMVKRADDAVYGEIVGRTVFSVEEADGSPLYLTQLTLEGRSLRDGVAIRVDVLFHGGFVDETHGVFNSEAPPADDTRVGAQAVVFYRWVENLGAGVSGNALLAAHGGMFRTVEGPQGAVALGQGTRYALESNVRVSTLESAVRNLSRGQ